MNTVLYQRNFFNESGISYQMLNYLELRLLQCVYSSFAQSAGAVKYTDGISAEG